MKFDPDRGTDNFFGMVSNYIFGSSDGDLGEGEDEDGEQQNLEYGEDNWRNEIMKKPLIEQWMDDYWYVHMPNGLTIMQMDERVRRLLHLILIIGDEQLGKLRD